ncbi:hypothetical protein NM208_g9431 [Fusarium decemcellulare]|uniref:Uncharacterized protein n=1 Tax=Fusarium decemcellulare TaxID=57161 RepID=A0ACC1S1P7_9HYPO|nr:hypothetical protein NM208_g9431 [Fusarium decemcellulare]
MFVLVFLCLLQTAAAHADFAITAAPEFPFKREAIVQCDGTIGFFRCPEGTCYWGDDGFVGCCRKSSCAPRTTCIEYADLGNNDCDHETGGCVVCSREAAPFCVTNTNVAMKQYGFYCDVERRIAKTSITYDMPSGAVIRPVGGETATATETTSEETTAEETTTEEAKTETTETEEATTESKESTETSETTTETEESESGTTESQSETGDSRKTPDSSALPGPAEDSSTSTTSDSKYKTAVAAASALGAILGTLILLGVAFFVYRKRSNRDYPPQQPSISNQPSPNQLNSTNYYQTYSNSPSHTVSPISQGGSVGPNTQSHAFSRQDSEAQMSQIPELGRFPY